MRSSNCTLFLRKYDFHMVGYLIRYLSFEHVAFLIHPHNILNKLQSLHSSNGFRSSQLVDDHLRIIFGNPGHGG